MTQSELERAVCHATGESRQTILRDIHCQQPGATTRRGRLDGSPIGSIDGRSDYSLTEDDSRNFMKEVPFSLGSKPIAQHKRERRRKLMAGFERHGRQKLNEIGRRCLRCCDAVGQQFGSIRGGKR
jgi:hypothetical protein